MTKSAFETQKALDNVRLNEAINDCRHIKRWAFEMKDLDYELMMVEGITDRLMELIDFEGPVDIKNVRQLVRCAVVAGHTPRED